MRLTKEEVHKKGWTTVTHLCVPVGRALKELLDGNNLFNQPAGVMLRVLSEYESAGKEYICGCDNESSEGRCNGHYRKNNRKNGELLALRVKD